MFAFQNEITTCKYVSEGRRYNWLEFKELQTLRKKDCFMEPVLTTYTQFALTTLTAG